MPTTSRSSARAARCSRCSTPATSLVSTGSCCQRRANGTPRPQKARADALNWRPKFVDDRPASRATLSTPPAPTERDGRRRGVSTIPTSSSARRFTTCTKYWVRVASGAGHCSGDHLVLQYEIVKYEGDFRTRTSHSPINQDVMERKIAWLHESFPSQRSRQWFDDEVFRGHREGSRRGERDRYAEGFPLSQARVRWKQWQESGGVMKVVLVAGEFGTRLAERPRSGRSRWWRSAVASSSGTS